MSAAEVRKGGGEPPKQEHKKKKKQPASPIKSLGYREASRMPLGSIGRVASYRPSGRFYAGPPRSGLKAGNFAAAGFVSDPTISYNQQTGQVRIDECVVGLKRTEVSIMDEYSAGSAKTSKRLIWSLPSTWQSSAITSTFVDVRGNLIDFLHAEIEFENMTEATLTIRGNTPMSALEHPDKVVSRANYENRFIVKPHGKVRHRIDLGVHSNLRYPLVGNAYGFDLGNPQEGTRVAMALFDFNVVTNNINVFTGQEYPDDMVMVNTKISVHYIATDMKTSGQLNPPGSRDMILVADEVFGLQDLGSMYSIFHVDPILTPLTAVRTDGGMVEGGKMVTANGWTARGDIYYDKDRGADCVKYTVIDGDGKEVDVVVVTGWVKNIETIAQYVSKVAGIVSTVLKAFV